MNEATTTLTRAAPQSPKPMTDSIRLANAQQVAEDLHDPANLVFSNKC